MYGELKHSGNMASLQPFDFACCIRFTALATFDDLSAVTVNCNTAARRTTWIVHEYYNKPISRYVLIFVLPEELEEAILDLVYNTIDYFNILSWMPNII